MAADPGKPAVGTDPLIISPEPDSPEKLTLEPLMKTPFSRSLKPDPSKTYSLSDSRSAGSFGGRSAAHSMTVLRRRLTVLYTVTTSLILTLVMAVFLLMRIRETRQEQMEDFYDLWNSLQFRLQSDTTIAQGFLAQTESDHKVVIHIEENGTALLFNGSWTPQTPRGELIERVKTLAEAEGVFTTVRPISASSVVSSIFTFQGESGEDYCARVLVSAFGRSVRALCLIAYVPAVTAALRTTLIWLAALELLGVAGLSAISWYFVGWSLKPVEESQRKQAEFIAAASHELRSPLAVLRSGIAALRDLIAGTAVPSRGDDPGVSGLTDAPASRSPTAGQTADLLAALDSECGRMARLIDDMLLLASADAKTWSLTLSDVDMDTLLIDTYDAYLPLCRRKGLSLQLDLPETPLPALRGDQERIRQILSILLDNAMTYTPAGKKIRICAETGECLILRVIDEGPGIPDDMKTHIFDRFFRADSSRSDKSHFGLGLSIAKELVSLHGGTIRVSDAGEGGSCFTVTFPRSA